MKVDKVPAVNPSYCITLSYYDTLGIKALQKKIYLTFLLFYSVLCFFFLVGSNAAKPNISIVETRVHNYNSLARHVNLEYFKEIVYG